MMKKAIIVILLVMLLFFACDKSVVIDRPPIRGVDTTEYVPRMRKDTIHIDDTTREPISFEVTVDDWGDETEITE